MLEDSRQRLWLGMTNGVCCFDPSDSSLQHFTHRLEDQHSLSSDRVRSILEDRSGTVYIGTWGGGLSVFNEQARSFTRYTKPNGLAGNIVSGMLEDKLGNIWMATFSGLSKFNPTQKTFRNYFTSEIQDVGTFHSHAFLKTGDGRFLFGGNGLLSCFIPTVFVKQVPCRLWFSLV